LWAPRFAIEYIKESDTQIKTLKEKGEEKTNKNVLSSCCIMWFLGRSIHRPHRFRPDALKMNNSLHSTAIIVMENIGLNKKVCIFTLFEGLSNHALPLGGWWELAGFIKLLELTAPSPFCCGSYIGRGCLSSTFCMPVCGVVSVA
jgi:hypothetical protein